MSIQPPGNRNLTSYEDIFCLDSVDIGVADYILPTSPKGSFNSAWEALTDNHQIDETYALGATTLEEAVNNLLLYIGLGPCEKTEKVPEGKSSHVLSYFPVCIGTGPKYWGVSISS